MSAPHSEPISLPCRDPAHEDKHPLVTLMFGLPATARLDTGLPQTDRRRRPMASTRTKNLARAIQRANPGMKYTEALRQVESGGATNLDPKGPELLHDALRAQGEDAAPVDPHKADEVSSLDPLWFAEGPSADEEKKARWLQRTNPGLEYEETLRIVRQPLAPGYIQALDEWVILAKARKTPRFDPHATLEWDPKTGNITVLDEVHTTRLSGEAKRDVPDWLDRLARQARRSPQREAPKGTALPLLIQSLSDIVGHPDSGDRAEGLGE